MLRGMQEPRAFWREIYDRFDPAIPAKHDGWRAERPYSPRKEIISALQRPIGSTRFLLMGTAGTGKTTELLAIGDALTRTHLVVYLDLWTHFEASVGDPGALQRLQPWEVLAITGLAVLRVARDQFGHKWDEKTRKSFENSLKSLLPDQGSSRVELDVFKLAGTVAVLAGGGLAGVAEFGLTTLSRVLEAGAWELQLGERGQPRQSERDPRVHNLLGAINGLFLELQTQLNRQVAVLIDGLDRVEDPETTSGLFIDSTLLSSLEAVTVIVAPIRHKIMATQMHRFTVKVLANAPVLDSVDPRKPARRGLDFLADVFARRLTDLEPPRGVASSIDVLPKALLDRLAQFSGGRVRDFVRLIRLAAEQAYDESTSIVNGPIVEGCLHERRRVIEMGLTRADLKVLEEVARDPQHLLPDSDRVDRLIATDRLLPFPNDSEWYYPHPLLTLRLMANG